MLKSKKPICTGMLLSGKLNVHLEKIDRSASKMFSQLVDEMAKRENITETLKAENQMECVRRTLRSAAEEVVLNDLIYI